MKTAKALSLTIPQFVAPVWAVIDGHPGLRKAVGLVWPPAIMRQCCVHKLRNLERKAPKQPSRRSGPTSTASSTPRARRSRAAYAAFERNWTPRCPGVVRSLQEGGEELLTFFRFPKRQSSNRYQHRRSIG
jgi:transposase-like protein